jgi:hypothetical protein
LYPNPVNENQPLNIQVNGYQNQEILVVVRSIQGDEYFSKVLLVQENNQLFSIDDFKLIPAGNYIVTSSSNEKINAQNVIIK